MAAVERVNIARSDWNSTKIHAERVAHVLKKIPI